MSFENLALAQQSLPKHVAIIMDGNGRWAQQQGKPRVWGHKNGVESVRGAVRFCRKLKISSLTLFAFSSENWRRPEDEISTLMELFMLVLTKEVKKLHKNDVKLNIIGERSRFSEKLQKKIAEAEELTKGNVSLQLNIAANYGGQWDIAQASQKVTQKVLEGKLSIEDVTEEEIAKHVCLADQPELDLLIRTGGDERISNFLLWQTAYSELYFSDTLWPDFGEDQFSDAVAAFVSRERRFGCTGSQIKTLLEQDK